MRPMNSKAKNGATIRKSKMIIGRLNVVAPLLVKGYTLREIRVNVMETLGLKTYSLCTVYNDTKRLMEEWRDERVAEIDHLVALELRRLDARDKELWEQWEKSKEESVETVTTLRGGVEDGTGRARQSERRVKQVTGLGDVAIMREIRENAAERAKLLGLYAPAKAELSGELNVGEALMTSGVLTEEDIRREVPAIEAGK